MDLDKFKEEISEKIAFEELFELVPSDMWVSNPTNAAVLALRRSDLFDEMKYLSSYPDVADNAVDPIVHYVTCGFEEHRILFLKKKNNPEISVLLPVYNSEQYLEECIESVLNQTFADFELICIDDGSTDRSSEILDDYARKDGRVIVLHKKNAGYGHSMNLGLRNARGRYICIIESDDYIEKDMYSKLYECIEQNRVDFVKCNFSRFYGENEQKNFEIVNIFRDKNLYETILNPTLNQNVFTMYSTNWNGIFKKSFLDKNKIFFNETPGASFQDTGFWFITLACASRIYVLRDSLYMLRRDNPDSSIKNPAKLYCMTDEHRYVEQFLRSNGLFEAYANQFYFSKFRSFVGTYNRIDVKYKRTYLKHFSDEFRNILETHTFDKPFSNNNVVTIQKIVHDYKKYFFENSGTVKVSVVIPVFNAEKYLYQCLESVIEQDLREIEILCIDDGSTDRSLEILESVKDWRLKIIRQSHMGAGAARNTGIHIAQGEFIAFMDADDLYPSTSVLSRLYYAARQNDVLVCGGGIDNIKDGEIVESPDPYRVFEQDGKLLYRDYQFDYGYYRYIFNRAMLLEKGIRFPDYLRFQDPPFFVRAMDAAGEFYAVTDITYRYRKYSAKQIAWTREKISDLFLGLADVYAFARKNSYDVLADRILYRVENEYDKVLSGTSFLT